MKAEIDAANFPAHTFRMAKKAVAKESVAAPRLKPSTLLDSHYVKVMLD
jgi:hypothetical protein